jgi:hypothetical protein
MATKSTVKVTVKKTSGGKPKIPNMTSSTGGALFATQIRAEIKKKKTQQPAKKNG